MPQSKTRKKPAPRPTGGKKITDDQKLQRATELCVELVRDLQPRLTEEQYLELRAGALGMLITLSVLTNKPDPRELAPVPGHTPPRKE
jgi:hypothetical protein